MEVEYLSISSSLFFQDFPLVIENNDDDHGSISLSTKCQQLRKPLVVVSLVVVSSDNLISLAWMSDLEMKNFIFLWTAASLALNMLVTMGIPLKNRRIIQIWLCIQGIFFLK